MHDNKDSITLVSVSLVIVAGAISLGLGSIARSHNRYRGEFAEVAGKGLLIAGAFLFVLVLIKCLLGGRKE